jgi:hypothetical protein
VSRSDEICVHICMYAYEYVTPRPFPRQESINARTELLPDALVRHQLLCCFGLGFVGLGVCEEGQRRRNGRTDGRGVGS